MWVSIRGWRCQKAGRPSKGHGSHHRSHEPRRDISQFNLAPPWRGNPGTSLLNIAFARLLFRPPQAAMLTMLALALEKRELGLVSSVLWGWVGRLLFCSSRLGIPPKEKLRCGVARLLGVN
jgi:hypothetical protein